MKLKRLLQLGFFALICFVIQPAMAQNKVITGRVTDSKDKSALIGVSIIVKGSTTGTNTDASGSFRITVPASATTLVVSYIGYTSKEVSIPASNNVNVTLTSTTNALNEVVVVGYGTQRVKDATGSVASLGPKDFNKGIISTPDQLIQGRIAGVQVTPSSGEPGGSASINIRGTGSIRAGNDPLYVIDGVPITNDTYSGSGATTGSLGSSSARSPLSFLNPADIENISVLKDASASAIYGSRGANGVVLITTRKGRAGQGIQFSANTTVATTASRYKLLNASQFVQAVNGIGADASAINKGANVDYQKEIFRTALSQSYTLGFGGANKQGFTYRASFGYDDQNGIVKKSALKRLTGRINASQSLFKDVLKFDLNFLASNVKDTYAPITDNAGAQGSLIGAALTLNPTYPVKNPDGTYFFDGSNRNPVAMLNQIDDRDNINRYLGNFGATLKLFKNLSYRGTFGNDYSTSLRKTFYDPNLAGYTESDNVRGQSIAAITGSGRGQLQYVTLSSQITEHTLNYDKRWADNSALTVLGGYSYQVFKNFGRNDVRSNTSTPNVLVKDINNFTTRVPIYGDSTKYELQSFYGRANYSYKDRYLVTATVRTDGSSKFGANHKYATFPALAVKWKIMNESFAPKTLFDELSLRLNYGKTGNQEFPAYQSLAVNQYNFGNNSTTLLYSPNPDLKWETSTQYGAGIDFAILKGRLTGSIDYFNKNGKDLLFFQYFSAPAPSPGQWINLPGNNINKGLELGLNFAAVQGNKFTWDIAYNMTILKNTVKNFAQRVVNTGAINGQGLSGAFSQVIQNGYPLFTFKVAQYNGLDAKGFAIYPNGIDAATLQGSALPKFTAGLTNNFSYGKWSLSFFLNAATGFYVYNNTANAYFYRGNLVTGHNVTTDVAFTNENALNSGQVSTRWLEKGDFLRLSNATLGYTFNLNNSKTFKTLRLNLTGQNLLLITNYSGLDPEINTNKQINNVPSRGIDYTSYPKARTITFGLNAGF
ncbi:SusC/RagA family TonB-linked outer membrane protein [uncultured Mucilaginibacter sp.]|uniref:SusC/RagA family TonB-linked outer membrane protein n=1 Tax=uncultured Mucilaginibacter sp. TaxID=797541 RepID=UPI00262A0379|nr:SusC/RagA family TonB-linked outer membrane protein [uncultured Mucilaginibacter sp.]